MALTEYKLGDFIEILDNHNGDLTYGIDDVRGVNNLKSIIFTKADLSGRDLSKFSIIYPGDFFFNHRTSRNGEKFSITYNNGDAPFIVTEDYVVFRIKESCADKLLKEWLYMFFCRPEFDRYVITNSWGSSTEFFNWDDICSITLPIPSIDIQRKYVAIYNAMVANYKSYERGLDDLKLVCDAYIENLRRQMPCEKIGDLIEQSSERNAGGIYGIPDVRGISIQKKFIETKADMSGVSLAPYYVVKPNEFCYVTVTSRNGEKISIAINDSAQSYIVSSSYIVFRVKNTSKLDPQYLFMFFNRSEFDRYARFHSWGSARETFDWDGLINMSIPIPDIKIQKAIVEIHKAYLARKKTSDFLKQKITEICPILIKGSIEGGGLADGI